jgi:hypothetical protein
LRSKSRERAKMDSFVRHTRTKGHDKRRISVGPSVTLGHLLSSVSDLLTANTTTTCLLIELPNMIGKILKKSRSDVVCLTQRDQVLPENDGGEIHFWCVRRAFNLVMLHLYKLSFTLLGGAAEVGEARPVQRLYSRTRY